MHIKKMLVVCALGCWFSAAVLAEEDNTFHALRLEVDAGENSQNEAVANWDVDGWIGGDTHKLWLKSEGEIVDQKTERSEIWALYSYNATDFWDVQAGVRYDNRPHEQSYFVVGVIGLAPYFFETQAHAFFTHDGDVGFRLREENDFLLTQKLIIQPYLEVNAYAQAIKKLEVGSGLSDATLGLQLRYEITRKFAPYLDVSYGRQFGETADYTAARGEDSRGSSITAGIRWLF
jgi:copper resistance protein B